MLCLLFWVRALQAYSARFGGHSTKILGKALQGSPRYVKQSRTAVGKQRTTFGTPVTNLGTYFTSGFVKAQNGRKSQTFGILVVSKAAKLSKNLMFLP